MTDKKEEVARGLAMAVDALHGVLFTELLKRIPEETVKMMEQIAVGTASLRLTVLDGVFSVDLIAGKEKRNLAIIKPGGSLEVKH